MLRKTSYILCIVIILLAMTNLVFAKVFEAGVAVQKDLPPDLYGTWQVISKRLETNNPYLFKSESEDIWNFSKQNGYITLTNPETNASATINVNEVKDNIATFSRQKKTFDYIEKENCKLNLEKNSFDGVDTLIFEYYRGNQLLFVNKVKYRIQGKKITGSSLNNLFAK